jgi:hypothetical protein
LTAIGRKHLLFWTVVAGALTFGAAACAADDPPEPLGPLATGSPTAVVGVAGSERTPAAFDGPPTWIDSIDGPHAGEAWQISCLDRNSDRVVDTADGPQFAGLYIPLVEEPCGGPARTPDFYVALPSRAESTCAGRAPVVLVIIGGGGTQLLDATSGVSFGLLEMRNALYALTESAGVPSSTIITTSAISGADLPQTRMEQWLEVQLRRRLESSACLRAVLFGHSHGGVTATSVMATLESRFPARLYGVILDRSIALYDRAARELPLEAPLLNVYQLNEGWHGVPIDQPNVVNIDQSSQVAPVEPRSGPEPVGRVTHTNLDDSLAVQTGIVTRVMEWILQ